MQQPRCAAALASLALAAGLALTASEPAAAAGRPAAPDTVGAPDAADTGLVQVATAGPFGLPSGLYRLITSGYAAQFGVDADGDVVSSDTAGDFWGAAAPRSLDGEDLVQLDAGYRHALALDRSGHVSTWGYLGDPDSADPTASPRATVPAEVAATTLTQVAAGGDHDLGVTAEGTVVGWGTDENGTLDVPDDLTDVVQVDTGSASSVALLADGTVRSWGYVGAVPSQYADQTFTDVAAGGPDVLALTTDGHLVGWGATSVSSAIPARVTEGTVVAVDVGLVVAAAVLDTGEVVQWGRYAPPDGAQVASFPEGAEPLALQLDRYTSAAISTPTQPDRAPTLTEVGPPHRGLAKLTVDPGTWSAMDDPEFTYRWSIDGQTVRRDPTKGTITVPWSRLGSTVAVVVQASDGRHFGRAAPEPVTLRIGRARFDVDAPATVRRGGRLHVEASGLATQEDCTLLLGGQPIATGTAGKGGRISLRPTVPDTVSRGRQQLVLVGATDRRFGSVEVRVLGAGS